MWAAAAPLPRSPRALEPRHVLTLAAPSVPPLRRSLPRRQQPPLHLRLYQRASARPRRARGGLVEPAVPAGLCRRHRGPACFTAGSSPPCWTRAAAWRSSSRSTARARSRRWTCASTTRSRRRRASTSARIRSAPASPARSPSCAPPPTRRPRTSRSRPQPPASWSAPTAPTCWHGRPDMISARRRSRKRPRIRPACSPTARSRAGSAFAPAKTAR